MSKKHNKPSAAPENEKERVNIKGLLNSNASDYESYYSDEFEESHNPWVVPTEGSFTSSKEFYNRGEIDEILGSDSSLRERRMSELEKVGELQGLDSKAREDKRKAFRRSMEKKFTAETILNEQEDAEMGIGKDPEEEIEEKIEETGVGRIIRRQTRRLDTIEDILSEVERTLAVLFEGIDINSKDALKQLGKRHIIPSRLDKIFKRVEGIKFPGELAHANNDEINREIKSINRRRSKQMDRANDLLDKLNKILAPRHERDESERQRTEKRIAEKEEMRKLASEMGEYLTERIEAVKALDRISGDYKNGKKIDWDERTRLNEDIYEASLGLMLFLRKLRDENPDKILKLIPALDQSVRGNFYAVLRAFFRSHNTGITADEIKEYGVRSKNMNFANELIKFAEKAPEKDREYSFHRDVTMLPEKILDKLFHPVQEEAKEAKKEIKEAA
jgi:hypothetical protein